MTRDEVDNILDLMAAEGAKGDPGELPGAIFVGREAWVARVEQRLRPRTIRSVDHGMRYRGVRILVALEHEDRVATRAEAGEKGQPFEDLAPRS